MKQFFSIARFFFAGFFFFSHFAFSDTVDIVITTSVVAGEIKPLLGVNAGPYQVAEATTDVQVQFRDIGVSMVRTHDFYGPLDMRLMYENDSADPSDPASYNFTDSDTRLKMIADNGHQIYFRLGNSWDYDGTPPSNISNFIEASKNVIRHYTEGLWDGYTYRIPYIEIWNEPDLNKFWTGTDLQFFQFFAQTITELKATFPNIKIGGPGFVVASYILRDTSNYVESFLRYCRNLDIPLDFISWHMYSNDPKDYLEAGQFYRGLLDEYGYTNAESHTSEWNSETGPVRCNPQGMALMTGAWIGLQDGNVDIANFYRGQNNALTAPLGHGLLFADGSYKKVAYAFKAWSRMPKYPVRIKLEESKDTISGIAGMTKDGKSLAVLLTHFSVDGSPDSIDQYQLRINGWTEPIGTLRMERYIVSDLYDLELVENRTVVNTESSPASILLLPKSLPVNTIELILFSKDGLSSVNKWDRFEQE